MLAISDLIISLRYCYAFSYPGSVLFVSTFRVFKQSDNLFSAAFLKSAFFLAPFNLGDYPTIIFQLYTLRKYSYAR